MNFSSTIAGLWVFLFLMPVSMMGQQTTSEDSLKQAAAEGQMLFVGKAFLSNGGPPCISCHTLDDPALPFSGGSIAINITSLTVLPPDALRQRITEVSLPHMILMKGAYQNHPVTTEEANKIIAYLKQVSEQGPVTASVFPAGLQFLWVGLGGFIIILLLIWLSWRKRKYGSVNKRIYQRQIQSV